MGQMEAARGQSRVPAHIESMYNTRRHHLRPRVRRTMGKLKDKTPKFLKIKFHIQSHTFMKCTSVRYTSTKCTSKRYTSERYTPKGCTPRRCTPGRCTFGRCT